MNEKDNGDREWRPTVSVGGSRDRGKAEEARGRVEDAACASGRK